MSRRPGRMFVKQVILTLVLCNACFAQPPHNYEHITSMVEDNAGNLLVLSTQSAQTIKPPSIQYVPNGIDTTMVADFAGVIWDHPDKVIVRQADTLKQIRFGQYRLTPPIFRVAITTGNPEVLSRLAFDAAPGTLVIKLPTPITHIRSATATPLALVAEPMETPAASNQPLTSNYSLPVKHEVSKPLKNTNVVTNQLDNDQPQPVSLKIALVTPATTNLPLSTVTHKVVDPKSKTSLNTNTKPLSAAPVLTKNTAGLPAHLSVSVANTHPLTIQIAANRQFTYQALRVSDPERYVIDLPLPVDTSNLSAPTLTANLPVKNIRAGHPNQDPKITRLVFDLVSAQVTTKAVLSTTGNCLTVMVDIPHVVTALPKNLLPLPNVSFVLDAGHGGSDPGAQRGDVQEKNITLAIIKKLQKLLLADGAKVTLTRNDDSFVSLENRTIITNTKHPCAFISVHINSLETNTAISGIETYYENPASHLLATTIHQALVSDLSANDRAVRQARFYVINHTPVPAILAEVGFISNPQEQSKLVTTDYQNQIAKALEHGIIQYFNCVSQPPTSANSKDSPVAQTQDES